MKKSTIKKIWIAAIALMAFGAVFEVSRPAMAETGSKPPGRR